LDEADWRVMLLVLDDEDELEGDIYLLI